MRSMLQRKRQFLQNGTLKVDKAAEQKEMMDKIQEEQLQKIQMQKEAEGCDDDDDSQGINEEENKVDPVEMLRNTRVMKAQLRREEWINHQVDEMQESHVQDRTFRKGAYTYKGAHINKHQFRGSFDAVTNRNTLASFSMPKTPNNFDNKMKATADG